LSIDFIMNGTARYRNRIARAWPPSLPHEVAVIGEPDSAASGAKDKAIPAIQRALLNLGFEMRPRRAADVDRDGQSARLARDVGGERKQLFRLVPQRLGAIPSVRHRLMRLSRLTSLPLA
jgi:hypothetical protein